jgi:alpha-L-fucosidase 2
MTFEARWRIQAGGGAVTCDPVTSSLVVEKADRVSVVMTGATNYRPAFPTYRGSPPAQRNQDTLNRASVGRFDLLRAAHIRDYQAIFGRVELDLGKPSRTGLPTDERLLAYPRDRSDRGLEALLFQYGRYLLIASSRSGGMPANLQGLWNNSNRPPWNGDYHLNINLQMNYWLSLPAIRRSTAR